MGFGQPLTAKLNGMYENSNQQNETKQAKPPKQPNGKTEISEANDKNKLSGRPKKLKTQLITIKWLRKGVRRQSSYSSRFDYGQLFIYLARQFNYLSTVIGLAWGALGTLKNTS